MARNQPLAVNGCASATSRLREIRRQKKIAQERLAALSGLSRGWVGFLERNPQSMTLTAAERLATALGVDVKELLP